MDDTAEKTDISELLELTPDRLDAVSTPANGAGWLLLKSTDVAADPESPHTESSEADAQEDAMTKAEADEIEDMLTKADAVALTCADPECDVCKETFGDLWDVLCKKKLTAADRKKIPKGDFAIPEKAPGPGSYPFHDRKHGANALSRSSGKPVAGRVRAAVRRKYPDMGKKSTGVPDESVRTPTEGGHLATGESGLAGPVTAGTKPPPETPSRAIGGETTYNIPDEARANASINPPIATKEGWELEVVDKQNWVSIDGTGGMAAVGADGHPADVTEANHTVLHKLADVYCSLKAAMAAQKQDPDVADPIDAAVWAHLEDVCATLKNALIDQAFDVVGLDAQMMKNAGNGPDPSKEENDMTTITKEDLASLVAESTVAALKVERKAQKAEQKAEQAKKAKKAKANAKKQPPWMAEKNANNGGDITAEAMASSVHGQHDANDVDAVGGSVDSRYVNKDSKKQAKKDKALKSINDTLAQLGQTVQKMANKPRSGAPYSTGKLVGQEFLPPARPGSGARWPRVRPKPSSRRWKRNWPTSATP